MPKVSQAAQARLERNSPIKGDRGPHREHLQVKTEPQDGDLHLSAKSSSKRHVASTGGSRSPVKRGQTSRPTVKQKIPIKKEEAMDSEDDPDNTDDDPEIGRRSAVKHESLSSNESNFEGSEARERNERGAEDSAVDAKDNMTLINKIDEELPEFTNYGPSIRVSGWFIKGGHKTKFCRHAFATDQESEYQSLRYWRHGENDNRPYHYLDENGSISFQNADQSIYYYNNPRGYSRYTLANGKVIFYSDNPDVEAERAKYCFPCEVLDRVDLTRL